MSLVSYSCSTDSEDELDNSESKTEKSKHIEMKRKVLISAFNLPNNCETNYEKNIKLLRTKNQSTLLDILPQPKSSQSNKFRKSINNVKNFHNTRNNCKKENNFSFLNSTEISNNVKSAKNDFNVSTSTSYNDTTENITSINLSENQYKRLKKDAAPNIRNINVTDMLEDQKLRICKKITEDISTKTTTTQEHVEEPSMPSIKKNHITYLAYKAKINEQDLKNQWSLNKMTRQQTRAKYGF